MNLKQFYLSQINGAMLREDEETIKYYEEKLNELLREEYEEKVKKVKASK
jgi:hypothetical protein